MRPLCWKNGKKRQLQEEAREEVIVFWHRHCMRVTKALDLFLSPAFPLPRSFSFFLISFSSFLFGSVIFFLFQVMIKEECLEYSLNPLQNDE